MDDWFPFSRCARLGLVCLAAVFSFASPAAEFALTDLGTLPGFTSSRATAINQRGQVVGWTDTTNDLTRGFLWENGVMTDLGTFGGTESLASGINNSGDIVGAMIIGKERHAFLRHDGKTTDLGMIDRFTRLGDAGNYNPGIGINGRGRVAGRLTVAGDNHRSFLWADGQTAYFGLLGDGTICYAHAINDRGQIVGQSVQADGSTRGFLWQDGQITDLGTLGGTRSSATAVNDAGDIIGWSTPVEAKLDAAHAFIWRNGALQDLGTLGGTQSRAYGINTHGQVVGYATKADGTSAAFLWDGKGLRNLNDLVPADTVWRLTSADAINDRGQNVAVGVKNHQRHACLLTPAKGLAQPPATRLAATATAETVRETTATEAIQLTGFERLPDGSFRLGFAGLPNVKYVVEASANLKTWTPLGSAANDNGKVQFNDAEAAKFTLRFYRAVPAP